MYCIISRLYLYILDNMSEEMNRKQNEMIIMRRGRSFLLLAVFVLLTVLSYGLYDALWVNIVLYFKAYV
jgi:uncharacterized protein YqhQ